MVKGCKLSICIADGDVTRLRNTKGSIRLKLRVYEMNEESSKIEADQYEYKFLNVFNKGQSLQTFNLKKLLIS